jgi:hypothetical protein
MKKMKKLMIVLLCGFLLVPFAAWGQKWVEPYTDKDGTKVEGHWQTPDDLRKDQYSTPGKVNPYTGQFNPYSSSLPGPRGANPTPLNPTPMTQNPYYPQQDFRFPGAQSTNPNPAVPNPASPNPYFPPQPDYRYRGN